MKMKKLLAAALALLMTMMTCVPAFAETGISGDRLSCNVGNGSNPPLSDLAYEHDESRGEVFFYLTAEPSWKIDERGDTLIRIECGVKNPTADKTLSAQIGDDAVSERRIIPEGYYYFNIRYDEYESEQRESIKEISLNWKDKDEDATYTKIDLLKFVVVASYQPLPAELDRISCEDNDAMMSNGYVTRGGNESVTVTAPYGANSYSVNEDARVTGNAFTRTEDGDYTIKWYKSIGETDVLVATDTLSVQTRISATGFTPFDGKMLLINGDVNEYDKYVSTGNYEHSFDGVTISPSPWGEQVNGMAFTITMNIDQQWAETYLDKADSGDILIPIFLVLPENAVKYARVGSGNDSVDELFQLIKNVPYSEEGRVLFQFERVASASYDGTTAIVTPRETRGLHSLFKYIDGEGNEHFHYYTINIVQNNKEAVRVNGAMPSEDRLMFNTGDNVNIVDREYANGEVIYYLDAEAGAQDTVVTAVKAPVGATNCTNGEFRDGYCYITHRIEDNFYDGRNYPLEWKDETGDTIKKETLVVKVIPRYMGICTANKWAPAGGDRLGYSSTEAAGWFNGNMTLKNGGYLFDIQDDFHENLDLDKLSEWETSQYFELKAPADAASFKAQTWTTRLYNNDFERTLMNNFSSSDLIPLAGDVPGDEEFRINDAHNGIVFTLGGPLLIPARLKDSDVTVYSVNKTLAGYCRVLVVQWYDTSGNLIPIGEKSGEYVYLQSKGYGGYEDDFSQGDHPSNCVNLRDGVR